MRWDRISVLLDQLNDELERQGWFQLDAEAVVPTKLQEGTVRTNCMDNLDRTNVVQAALAKHTLMLQLRQLGIIPEDAGVDDYSGLSQDFRESKSLYVSVC
jgi:phosphatidylinositol 4-phosphatase